MTTKEKIEVMQAYEEGKQIQSQIFWDFPWEDVDGEPVWNWGDIDYRVKPEEKKPKYRPYYCTAEMSIDFAKRFNHGLIDNNFPLSIWVKCAEESDFEFLVTGFMHNLTNNYVHIFNHWTSLNELFESYTYLDGSPCGKLVE